MVSELLQLDREWITNLCSNGVSFLKELHHIFHEQGEGYIALVNDANVLRQNSELCDQTHRLKGSASSLGLRRLATMASEFEKALREGKESETDLKEKGAAMIAEVQSAIKAVEQYIAEIENKK